MNYFQKYEKYKKKYLQLKGGNPQLIAEINRLRLELARVKAFTDVLHPDDLDLAFIYAGREIIQQLDMEEVDDVIHRMYYDIKQHINIDKFCQLDEASKNNFLEDFNQYMRKFLKKDLSARQLAERGYEGDRKRIWIDRAANYVIDNLRSEYNEYEHPDDYEESDDEHEPGE